MTASKMESTADDSQKSNDQVIRVEKLTGHVGFDSIPDQIVNRSMRDGFVFNILCIGETGIGKSTLMDSLFDTTFEAKEESSHNFPRTSLKANMYELKESSVKLKLTIIHTIGYGDQIDKTDSFKVISHYIDDQFEAYLQEELKINRALSLYHDTRPHVCLYFVRPGGHALNAIDFECMKQLDKKCNIIPIIAKADAFSKPELNKFKSNILSEMKLGGIDIYKFPIDDESIAEVNTQLNAQMPLAVVGSKEFVSVGSKMVRARSYPWGVVQVEDESHNDFVKLREMLIRTNMEDMREKTHSYYYELYRVKRLKEMGFEESDDDSRPKSFQQSCEEKKAASRAQMQKMEDSIRQDFIVKVRHADEELKETEKKLRQKFDDFKRTYEEDKKDLEDKQEALDSDIQQFYLLKNSAKPHSSSYTLSFGRNKKK